MVGTQDELRAVFQSMPEALDALQKLAEERLLDRGAIDSGFCWLIYAFKNTEGE